MDLNQLLQGNLPDGLLDQLTNQLGGADKKQTESAATAAISSLISGLARNAATPEGAKSLNNALERDHDGGILDNVMDLFNGQQSRTTNGAGIAKHVLGDKQSSVFDMISKVSGLDSNKSGNLLSMLAPVVMGALGRQKKQSGLDVGGIASLLSGAVSGNKSSNPMLDMATRFLDADGDGSIVDDLLSGALKSDTVRKSGLGFLGKLFGR